MYPVLIKIGPITIYTYGFFVAVGFLLGLYLAMRQAKREGISPERISDLGFYILIGAIGGSRLLYVALNAPHYLRNPIDIFKIWEGGLVFYGGLIAALALGIWYIRRHRLPVGRTADIFAPSLAIGHSIGRLGCFSAGCCYGRPTKLPWGVTFTNPESLAIKGIPLHPTQIYESLGEFLIFITLITYRKKRPPSGSLILAYGALYSVLRFFVEFLRGDEERGFVATGISISQAVSIGVFLVSVFMFMRIRKKTP